MKKATILSCVMVLLLFTTNAQSQTDDQKKVTLLKEFYVLYNAAWEKLDDPLLLRKRIVDLQQKYCTSSLQKILNNYYKMYSLEHDLIINDISTDSLTLCNTLSVTKDPTDANIFTVSYLAKIEDPDKVYNKRVSIKLEVLRIQENLYKINMIK